MRVCLVNVNRNRIKNKLKSAIHPIESLDTLTTRAGGARSRIGFIFEKSKRFQFSNSILKFKAVIAPLSFAFWPERGGLQPTVFHPA